MRVVSLSGERPEASDLLRGGELEVRSRRGLRPTEAALIEALPKDAPKRLLTGLDSEAAVALAACALWRGVDVRWWQPDAYLARKGAWNLRAHEFPSEVVACLADPPGFTARGAAAEAPYDVVALPFPAGSDALFARETLEQAHDLLAPEGRLLAAVDKDPTWLRDAVKAVFGKADLAKGEGGRSVVHGRRTREKAAWKDHAHVLQVAAPRRPLAIETRPGTFSYGRLDRGTKALMETLPPEAPPRKRVLDLGCGTGVLGLAALDTTEGGRALLVDSNARAVDLARGNAARNGLAGAEVSLRADFEGVPSGAFDLALANPPYFGDFRIAEAFVRTAYDALRDGGELRLVAKAAAQHAEVMRAVFGRARTEMHGEYGVIVATR